jgi:hypothetical protein
VSGKSDSEVGDRLDLRNMPENFHPAAVWFRIVLMAVSFTSMAFLEQLGKYLIQKMDFNPLFFFPVIGIISMSVLVFSVSIRFERWFPRAVSTKSWSGRAAIGWNVFHCELDMMSVSWFFNLRRGHFSWTFFMISII